LKDEAAVPVAATRASQLPATATAAWIRLSRNHAVRNSLKRNEALVDAEERGIYAASMGITVWCSVTAGRASIEAG